MINTVYKVLYFFERFFQRILPEPLQISFFLFYHKLTKRVMVAPCSVDLVTSSVDPWMCTKFMVNLRMMIPKMVVLPIAPREDFGSIKEYPQKNLNKNLKIGVFAERFDFTVYLIYIYGGFGGTLVFQSKNNTLGFFDAHFKWQTCRFGIGLRITGFPWSRPSWQHFMAWSWIIKAVTENRCGGLYEPFKWWIYGYDGGEEGEDIFLQFRDDKLRVTRSKHVSSGVLV